MQNSDYNHSELAADLQNGTFAGCSYAYTIEKTREEPEVYELAIHSTSLSELDEDQEGTIKEYLYPDYAEAEDDILTATRLTGIDFDRI